MAARRLPVISERDPLARPRTVGDCRGGIRPCPWFSCRNNLLIDVLGDGSLVLNSPSTRLAGADRTIADQHEYNQDAQWFVEVRIPRRGDSEDDPDEMVIKAKARAKQMISRARSKGAGKRRLETIRAKGATLVAQAEADAEVRAAEQAVRASIFALGPLATLDRAKSIADAWAAIHGHGTTRIHRKIPPYYDHVGPRREGALDTKFLDEATDAIERWFDEPDPNLPSCLLDEVDKLQHEKKLTDDDGALLERIANVMLVSRERVRQVEEAAIPNFVAALAAHGLTVNDLKERD